MYDYDLVIHPPRDLQVLAVLSWLLQIQPYLVFGNRTDNEADRPSLELIVAQDMAQHQGFRVLV